MALPCRRGWLALLGLLAANAHAGYYPGYPPPGWYPPPAYRPATYAAPTYTAPRYAPPAYGYARPYAPAYGPAYGYAPPAAPVTAPARPAPARAEAPKPPTQETPATRKSKDSGNAEPQGSSEEHKQAFLESVLPLVRRENDALRKDRRQLLALAERLDRDETLAAEEQTWLQRLAERFKVKGDPTAEAEALATLKRRVDVIPADLALAQAANESAWGRSRFAREANNLYGIWTFDPDQGLKPKRREANQKHLVRVFDSLRESVRVYLHTLNTHPAYRQMRDLREQLRADRKPLRGVQLAGGLRRYSGRGEAYVSDLKALIRGNALERYNGVELADARTPRDG